ncbi:MAG: P22 phage major capsid protein family protein [Nitrosopumilus sp.]
MTSNVFSSAGAGTAVNGVAWTNLNAGVFSPDIFSKKAQIAFRLTSVVADITNSEYYGEIANMGDTVRIIKEPEITIKAYQRGTKVTPQFLADTEITLTVDKANYFSFTMDDLEKQQAHLDWMALAANRAAYKLRDTYDKEVLDFMALVSGTNVIGSTGTPQVIVPTGATGSQFTPLKLLARAQRLLDEKDVPQDGRYFVADPFFYELLSDEDSKILNADYTEKGILRNGRVSEGLLRGFRLYSSNNLKVGGTGPTGTIAADHGFLLAGHISGVAAVEQISKTESFRSQFSFADEVRGLHLYGRGSLRPTSQVIIVYHSA